MSKFKELQEAITKPEKNRHREILDHINKMNVQSMHAIEAAAKAIAKPVEDASKMVQNQVQEMLNAFSTVTAAALENMSWTVDTVDALEMNLTALEPQPDVIPPLRRPEPHREDAFTWANKQVDRKRRIELSGKDPFCLLITPEGDKLVVSAFTTLGPNRIQFFLLDEERRTITIAYDQIENVYQFVLFGLDKPEEEEIKESFVN